MTRRARPYAVFAALIAVALTGRPAHAEDEMRLLLDMDYRVPYTAPGGLALRPMVRTEQRFRDSGLVLLKLSAGLRTTVRPWLTVQTYYAHKDKIGNDPLAVHLLVADLIPHVEWGRLGLSDKNSVEWHSQPGFYRYRNCLELDAATGLSGVKALVGDEVRFDSDQGRMNMNDFRLGGKIRLGSGLGLKLLYDLESNRRGHSTWAQTHVAWMLLAARL